MIDKITGALSQKGLSGWQVRWTKKKSRQSFIALTELECRRRVETESCIVSIYKKKPGGTLGMSTFKVTPAGMDRFDRDFEQALFAAELVNNQPFELPGQPKELPQVALSEKDLDEKTLARCEDRIRAAVSKEKSIRLSAAEFFVDEIESRLVNHKGLDVAQQETLLQTEFILLAKNGDRENEYINRTTRRFLEDFDIETEVRQSAQYARDATVAALPKTGRFPVLLSEEPLDQLFNPLVARASARLKYNKMMNVDLGANVLEGEAKGDRVTLWSNGIIDRAVGSNRFDGYGSPSRRVCLIEKNILKTYVADKRYADYVGIETTSEMGNIEVEAGTASFKELLDPTAWGDRPLYHLQAFSAFEPNAITGAFSAEIRAGYEITASGTRPIKGGSVSGVLQRDLLHCYLSKERVQRERALVPKGVFFSELTIAGA